MEPLKILANSLQRVNFGILLTALDASVIYVNTEAKSLFSRFVTLEQDLHTYMFTGHVDGLPRAELQVVDAEGADNYIRVEIVNATDSILCILEDITIMRTFGLRDKLTGLGNRAFFDQKMEEFTRKNLQPVSIIEGDMNGLKLVNDVFGHRLGDILLQEMSRILTRNVRGASDVICRWGGDEFAVILPSADSIAASNICYRILNSCETSKLEPIKPSLSLGYATQAPGETLHDTMKRAEVMMYAEKLKYSVEHSGDILLAMRASLANRSMETIQHSQRLATILQLFADHLGLKEDDCAALQDLAILHDVGIAALPDTLLATKGIYTELQREEMKLHVVAGYRAVKSVNKYSHLAIPVFQHHENWDGSGYPNGTDGNDINILARILRIVDSYEVMTRMNLYSTSMSCEKAMAEILTGAGSKYDPQLAQRFMEIQGLVRDLG